MSLRNFFRLALYLFLLVFSVHGEAVNRTIDDTLGDSVDSNIRPVFFPQTAEVWQDRSCSNCLIRPDPSKAFAGTWKAATFRRPVTDMSITLPFTGTAIYVYFILANYQGEGITTTTECNFTLDGQLVGSFLHNPTSSRELLYNQLVHASTGLEKKDHSLFISVSDLDHEVWVNFDYAIYTFENNTASGTTPSSSVTPTSSPTGMTKPELTGVIVGTVLGSLAILAIAGFIIYRFRRKTYPPTAIDFSDLLAEKPPQANHIQPFVGQVSRPESRMSMSGTAYTEGYNPIPAHHYTPVANEEPSVGYASGSASGRREEGEFHETTSPTSRKQRTELRWNPPPPGYSSD